MSKIDVSMRLSKKRAEKYADKQNKKCVKQVETRLNTLFILIYTNL